MDRVSNKVCIVTGAALGIGRACVLKLAAEGAKVALFDVRDEAANELVRELQLRSVEVGYWHVDVSREKQVAAAMEAVVHRFGGIDVLVNNAGIAGATKPTHALSEAEWDSVQAINTKGVFFCTKHAIGPLRERGGGSIINLSSIYGLVGSADAVAYHASKGAVRLMTKTDALTYAPDRIRVNSVHPGFIWTPMVEGYLQAGGASDMKAARAQVDALHPLGHMGEPDDIAWGVVYLASDESRFMTGAELVIDGGYTAR